MTKASTLELKRESLLSQNHSLPLPISLCFMKKMSNVLQSRAESLISRNATSVFQMLMICKIANKKRKRKHQGIMGKPRSQREPATRKRKVRPSQL
jgi:hypothetical protein